MVNAVTDNLEGLYNETEDKDLSMVNVSFKVIAIREAHLNKTIHNTVIPTNPISREIIQITIEAEAGAVDLSNSEDAAMEGLIIRIAMEGISITHARFFLLFLLVMHNALRSVGECCETVCEFFVRVLRSSRVTFMFHRNCLQ